MAAFISIPNVLTFIPLCRSFASFCLMDLLRAKVPLLVTHSHPLIMSLHVFEIASAWHHTLSHFYIQDTFHLLSAIFQLPLLFLFSLLPVSSRAVKTAVKHGLISQTASEGNPSEKIPPTFSSSCHTTSHKRWQETAVPSLTFYKALRAHTHAHSQSRTHTFPITGSAFESAESGPVWRNLMTHNVASILALHGQATRCTICPLFKGEKEGRVLGFEWPLKHPDWERVREWNLSKKRGLSTT